MSYAFDKDAKDGDVVTLENGVAYQYDAPNWTWIGTGTMATKTTSFPTFPPGWVTGQHIEHGRTWEYVEPGMWKSIGGSGGGGTGGSVAWADVTDKPQQ